MSNHLSLYRPILIEIRTVSGELRIEKCQQEEDGDWRRVLIASDPLLTHALIGLGNAKLFSTAENKHGGMK
jgi:hypothetical protein